MCCKNGKKTYKGYMKRLAILFLSLCLFTGCATVPTDPDELAVYEANNDPLEPMNRSILAFNLKVERYVYRPIILGYRAITTPDGRESIRVFLDNLKSPVTIFNDLIQGRFIQTGKDLSRLIINTTLGFFGFFDVADKMGIKPHKNSFATTLAIWNVPSGPYFMLPFVGPMDVRSATGYIADYFVDPASYIADETKHKPYRYAINTAKVLRPISTYERYIDILDDAYQSSADYYAFMRSAYRQGVAKMIREERGEEESVDNYNFDMEDDDE